jgi:hypothetical protein
LNERIKMFENEGIPVEEKTTEDYNFIEEEKNITENALLTKNRLGCALAYSQLKGRYSDLLSTSINRRLCIPTHTISREYKDTEPLLLQEKYPQAGRL